MSENTLFLYKLSTFSLFSCIFVLNYQTMISILVPIYNTDVTHLVQDVITQCIGESIPFEIILIDDNSAPEWKQKNRALSQLQNVMYSEKTEHIGRAKIRNELADAAKFPYLLFIDNDVKIEKQDFLHTYLLECQPNAVVYGGMMYEPENVDNANNLRQKYGRKKECVSASERQKNPYKSFNTINVLIAKNVFESIRFDESISEYGHEDTLFGFRLQQKNIPIKHIDNPVVHLNSVSNEEFVRQTKQSVENLYKIYVSEQKNPALCASIQLLKCLSFAERFHLVALGSSAYTVAHSCFSKITVKFSSLFFLNILKICYICNIAHSYDK